eukprot:m.267109 g.267109  ORF g.267109 m.267109 type:complete len:98 (-) comp19724_c0_seq2:231-524(-)
MPVILLSVCCRFRCRITTVAGWIGHTYIQMHTLIRSTLVCQCVRRDGLACIPFRISADRYNQYTVTNKYTVAAAVILIHSMMQSTSVPCAEHILVRF